MQRNPRLKSLQLNLIHYKHHQIIGVKMDGKVHPLPIIVCGFGTQVTL